MTTAYWCILIAGLLPFVWTSIAKFSGGSFGKAENLAPREFKATLHGTLKRAVWAEQNAFEAFPLFAAAVVVAHNTGSNQHTINAFAITYIALRLAHGIFYLANLGLLRSLVWFGSIGCVIGLFIIGA